MVGDKTRWCVFNRSSLLDEESAEVVDSFGTAVSARGRTRVKAGGALYIG